MHEDATALPTFANQILRNHGRGGVALSELLSLWFEGRVSHTTVSDEMMSFAEGMDVSRAPRSQLETLERLCQNVGLHRASGAFALKVRERIMWEAGHFKVPAAVERDLVSSIHWGDLERAKLKLDVLQSSRLNPRQVGRLETYQSYIKLWASSPRYTGHPGPPSLFYSKVQGKKVLVYGPGETSSTALVPGSFDLVARTCGYGKYVFDSPDDLVNNKTDVVYVNPEVFEIGGPDHRSQALEQLSKYEFVVTKRSEVPGLANNRTSTNISPLFIRGHPHKGTQMILDLLVHQPQDLWVIGMSFFLARNAYRPDSVGINAFTRGGESGRETHNLTGSEGGPFDLNWQYASHNLRENFSLIRNLFRAGAVSGDAFFSRVMLLSIDDYLRELDEVVGEQRV